MPDYLNRSANASGKHEKLDFRPYSSLLDSAGPLPSSAIDALIGRTFRNIPRALAYEAAASIFPGNVTSHQVQSWKPLSGADLQNVVVSLLLHLNSWTDSAELIRTPAGGHMRMLNTRIFEIREGLKPHRLTVACASIPGPTGRDWSFYRIAYSDEAEHKNGRIAPFRPVSRKIDPRKPIPAAPVPGIQPPSQQNLFGESRDTSARWVDPEMGARR